MLILNICILIQQQKTIAHTSLHLLDSVFSILTEFNVFLKRTVTNLLCVENDHVLFFATFKLT